MIKRIPHIGIGLIIGFLMLGLTAGSLLAQVAPVPDEQLRSQIEKSERVLDEESQELADEYLALLDDLNAIIEDYQEYLEEIDESSHCHDINFKIFTRGLTNGIYAENVERLQEDLQQYISVLKARQEEFDNKDDRQSRKCYRLIRSLSRELDIINDLLEDNISNRYAKEMISKEVQLYIKETLHELQQLKLSEMLQKIAEGLENIENIEDFEELKELERLEFTWPEFTVKRDSDRIKIIGPVPPVPPVPQVRPVAPEKGNPSYSYNYAYTDNSKAGLGREISAIMTISSADVPIYITNPVGNINITGSSESNLEASLNVRISADSRELEKKFVQETTLKASSKNDGYYVTAEMPVIRNENRTIHSTLTITLPGDNYVICNNKFGQINITDLNNGLKVEAANAKVLVTDIQGEVDIKTSMDTVRVSDIDGKLTIRNAYSPITIYDCEGDMNIENAYAPVQIMDSRGSININNSGITEIRDHKGDVRISNIYGRVFVVNQEGNLSARNAYSPIEIDGIEGDVELENNYSLINVNRIEGRVRIKNTFGNIKGDELFGPIEFTNENGNTTVIVSDRLRGPSYITSNGGLIRLAVTDETNLVISAQTTNNDIKSFFPIDISQEGNLKSGKIVFGRGDNFLTLKGSNTPIIISDN